MPFALPKRPGGAFKGFQSLRSSLRPFFRNWESYTAELDVRSERFGSWNAAFSSLAALPN